MTQLDLQQRLEEAHKSLTKQLELTFKLVSERDALQRQVNALADKLARSEDYCIGVDTERMEYINKCEALAAENKVLDSAIGAIADAYETGVSDILAQEIDTAVNIETPATDAIKRHWMAEGVEQFGEWQKELAKKSEDYLRASYVGSVKDAAIYSAKLRQPEEKGHE